MVVADKKRTLPSWKAVKTALQSFDRAGLLGLIQDLYAVGKDNKAFLHTRLGLGSDQLVPYKAIISRWICPDLMRNQSVSISKAKKAVADYKKATGQSAGLAELSIFYCEEAFSFVESCAFGTASPMMFALGSSHWPSTSRSSHLVNWPCALPIPSATSCPKPQFTGCSKPAT